MLSEHRPDDRRARPAVGRFARSCHRGIVVLGINGPELLVGSAAAAWVRSEQEPSIRLLIDSMIADGCERAWAEDAVAGLVDAGVLVIDR